MSARVLWGSAQALTCETAISLPAEPDAMEFLNLDPILAHALTLLGELIPDEL
jgi:hypothetical protein